MGLKTRGGILALACIALSSTLCQCQSRLNASDERYGSNATVAGYGEPLTAPAPDVNATSTEAPPPPTMAASTTAVQPVVNAAYQTEPRRALVRPGDSVSLLGRAGVPLDFCHFYYPPSYARVDLSQGRLSPSTRDHEYHGAGLEAGECGITLRNIHDGMDGIIESKIKAVDKPEFQNAATTLRVTNVERERLPVFEIIPNEANLKIGDNLTVICNADREINMCHIYLPGGRYFNLDNGAASEMTSEYRYYGQGLKDGHCGVTLTKVDERLNGFVVCKIGLWPETTQGAWVTDAFKATTVYKEVVVLDMANNKRLVVDTDSATPTTPATTEASTRRPRVSRAVRSNGLSPVNDSINNNTTSQVRVQTVAAFRYRVSLSEAEEISGDVTSTVWCTANRPLRRCWLQLPGEALMDFSAGYSYSRDALYEYSGRGPRNGECGVKFRRLPRPPQGEFRCVGVEGDQGVEMTLQFSPNLSFPFAFRLKSPHHLLAPPGYQPLTFSCSSSAHHPLTACHFYIPSLHHLDLRLGEYSGGGAGYEYRGAGLRAGVCGVDVRYVGSQHEGEVRCWGSVGLHALTVDFLTLEVGSEGLGAGEIAGIVIGSIGAIVVVSLIGYCWKTRRRVCSAGNSNDSDTDYEEIHNFPPKLPPFPAQRRLQLMAPSPTDSAYIEAVTIHNPEFDKHKTDARPPITETHSHRSANQAEDNLYGCQPALLVNTSLQGGQEKLIDKSREADIVHEARPGTYMYMRGVRSALPASPVNPANRDKADRPTYLSVLDPETNTKVQVRKKEESGLSMDTLYQNLQQLGRGKSTGLQVQERERGKSTGLQVQERERGKSKEVQERAREKSAELQDHPMFD